MVKKKSRDTLARINKKLDLELKVGGILKGWELDMETVSNGEQYYACEKVWYYTLVEKDNEYFLVECTENGEYRVKDIREECSFEHLTTDELDHMIKDMYVVD